MNKQEFINQVLHILNEAGTIDGAEMIGADMTQLNKYIEKHYPGAWRRAVKILPRSWFDTKSFADAAKVVDAPDGTGYVILPADFLLLSSFRMKTWKVACKEAQEETPDINFKQSNEYLRGTPYEPVCVLRLINSENTLKKAMYYYSVARSASADTHIVEEALYIPNVTTLADDVAIDDKLAEPLAYICAIAVLTTLEKATAAKAIEAELLKLI